MKQFKALIIIICSVSCMTYTANAQKGVLPGYIVTLNGDTLKGQIDYKNWSYSPSSITFKQEGSEKRVFTPDNCLAFAVADELYVRAEVPIQKDPDPDVSTPITTLDTVFLQTFFEGDKSLYYHQERGTDIIGFYIKTDAGYQYLEFKKYIKKIGEQTNAVLNKNI